MRKVVEWLTNFSDGRNSNIIEEIADYSKILFVIAFIFVAGTRILAQNREIDSLQNILQKADQTAKTGILLELALNYYINDNLAKAESSCQLATDLSIKLGDYKGQADALNTLAFIYAYFEPSKVIALCDSAFSISEMSNYEKGRIESIIIKAGHLARKEPLKALENLRKAQNEAEKNNFYELKANADYISGEIYCSIGNYLESTKYLLNTQMPFYEKANKYPTRFNKYQYGMLLNILAETYKYLNNFDEALKYSMKYLAITLETDDIWGTASCYNNIGILKSTINKPDEALLYYQKAVAEYNLLGSEQSGAEYNVANTYVSMANIFLSKNENKNAFELLDRSLKIFQKHKDSVSIASTLATFSEYWLKVNDITLAETALLQSLEIATVRNKVQLQMECFAKLSTVYEKLEKYGTALEFYKKYTSLRDTLLNTSKAQEVGSLTTNFENERKIEEEHKKAEIESKNAQRIHLLEYFGITIFVIILFISLLQLPKFHIKTKTIESLVFVTFLLTFQFLYVLISPIQSIIIGDDPLILFGTNIVIALLFMSFEVRLEKILHKRGVFRAHK